MQPLLLETRQGAVELDRHNQKVLVKGEVLVLAVSARGRDV